MKPRSNLPGRVAAPAFALLAAVAGLALAAAAPYARAQAKASEDRPAVQRQVLAYYHYSYQGDPRKQVPKNGIRTDKGLSLITDHPWESVGPWMSFDRSQWHKNQFQMMAAGGIDVALAVYKGDKDSRRGWALKGLDVMTQGLKELRSEGLAPLMKVREYPQIGLALDLNGLKDQYGGPVDLKQADVQRSLYGMVRDFYLHIPEEFRATIQLPGERQYALPAVVKAGGDSESSFGAASTSNGAAYIVRLINDAAVKDADASFLTYANRRFAQEFGARLIWVGTPALREKVRGFDAVAPYPAATQSAQVSGDGWIKTGSVGPGFDNSSQGPGGTIRPRENGQQTITDFRTVMEGNPDWVFLDSWNNYAAGSDIAPTLEYGLLYRDLVRAAVLQFKQSADYAADFLKASVPRVMMPGQLYQVEVVVQNSGTYDWDVFNVASLSYRWLKDGKYIQGPTPSVQNNGQIRGDKKSMLIGVASPVDKDGKALPPGQYELEFNMNRRVGNEVVWFDQSENAPFRVPVTIGNPPASRPFWSNSSMPNLAARGATYPAQIRLRNDGSDTWKRGSVSVGYRWRKVSTYLKGLQDEADTVVAEGKRVPLAADVAPGRMVTVDVPVSATDGSGQPLPTWSNQEDWVYVLEWDVFDGSKYLSGAGGATYREPVEVVERDPAPFFVGCSLPSELVAGRTEKITVGVQNNGPYEWKKGRDKVVVHWYYMDGTEASFNDDALPLQEDVPPFSRVLMDVPDDLPEKLLGSSPEADRKDDRDRKDEKNGKDSKDDKKAEREREKAAREAKEREEREARERERQARQNDDKKGGKKKSGKTHKEWVIQPTVLRDVPVRVPYYFGPMYCVFDFQHDGLNASTGAATKGNDILVIPVNVYSPTFTPLPAVNGFFNVDGMSQDVDRADGNIDGRGNSLPAEFMPPYVPRPSVGTAPQASPIYPSGLWVRPLNALDSSRACFWYPNKNNQVPNMIRCEGQKLEFQGIGRTAVHVLALSTEEDVKGDFLLYYSDGSVDRKTYTFTHWNDLPKHGELVAFSTPHRHTRAGDDPSTRCYIFHYTIPTERLKMLVGLELPRQPAVKVLGITLESATLRNSLGGN